MDQESIVYGCIKDALQFRDDATRKIANRRAMLALPKGDEWPYLSQEMFAIPSVDSSAESYHTEVMHFGASYRAIEYEWDQWLAKFEKLLGEMYWFSAVVHLETELTGIHTFTWETTSEGHIPGKGVQHVKCEWVRENMYL